MKYLLPCLALLAFTLMTSNAAHAQASPITVYCTTISENDKVASDGFELTDAGSILRQDRANFHKFGYRDAGDESDSYFKSTGNRARLPAMLEQGAVDQAVLRRIVRGTPRVCVSVYTSWIAVELE